MPDWALLLNEERRRVGKPASRSSERIDGRMELERDYDRVLFSTPVRRLADKTQVFPLEAHDAVHTRLTHSHEVSALARAVGLDLAHRFSDDIGLPKDPAVARNLAGLMAAVGLVHDLGNPPFGHQGERAIGRWFESHPEVFGNEGNLDSELRKDFTQFDGNAQTLRLVARLQLQGDEYGLNLTYGTLAALLKYTVTAGGANKDSEFVRNRKAGYFVSERPIVEEVWRKTGLAAGRRHPLTYLVEACDDIAYAVLDVEDTVKKDLASYADVKAYLGEYRTGAGERDPSIAKVLDYTDKKREEIRASIGGVSISPAELDDLSMQRFRVAAISEMVGKALTTFVAEFPRISDGSFKGELLEASMASALRRRLKEFLKLVTFPHRAVLEVELRGSIVISDLMDRLWNAITSREGREKGTAGPRADPLHAYTYSRVSENYRRVFENSDRELPMWYREARLLTDMIAGMTDSFAISLLDDLKRFDRSS